MSVELFQCGRAFSFLVVGRGKSAFIFPIDLGSGNFQYFGIPEIDIFPSMSFARRYLLSRHPGGKFEALGKYLIGAIFEENEVVISTITEDFVSAVIDSAELRTIKAVNYKYIPIHGSEVIDLPLEEFPVAENHFHCLELDLSSQYPYACTQNKDSFLWNRKWISIFCKLQVPNVCTNLYQGRAVSSSLKGDSLTYLIRRSVLNTGTRYIGRGLNEASAPGNECQCEILFRRNNKTYSNCWCRGSCPISWKTELSTSLSAPVHSVSDLSVTGTQIYFGQLHSRLPTNQIHLVSLLHENPSKGETDILNGYKTIVQQLSPINSYSKVTFLNYDINEALKKKKSIQVFQQFASLIIDYVKETGFNSHETKQKAVFRFNCADSLDRTNLATFYYALLIVANFEYDNQVQKIPQETIDFIGSSIISGGNVISMMYTNTLAIKTEPITQFMKHYESTSSETFITLSRRFSNVFSDPQRQLIINAYTIIEFSGEKSFVLYPDYISVFQPPSSDILISDILRNGAIFTENMSTTFYLMLPAPYVVTGLIMHVLSQSFHAAPSFTLAFGNHISSMHVFMEDIKLPSVATGMAVKYDLSYLSDCSQQFPIDPEALIPARFISFTFHSAMDFFGIGPISIRVSKPTETTRTFVYGPFSKSNQIPLKCENPSDLWNFEIFRMQNGLDIKTRNEELFKRAINPFRFDFPSRMLGQSPDQCAFCHNKMDPEKCLGFARDKKYSNLFSLSSSSTALLCAKCSKDLARVANDPIPTMPYAKNIQDTMYLVPPTFFIEADEITEVVSYFGAFIDCPEGNGLIERLLTTVGGEFKFNIDNDRFFSICLPLPAQLFTLTFIFNEDTPDFKTDLPPLDLSPRKKIFECGKITQLMNFTIKASPNKQLNVRAIELCGNFCKYYESPMIKVPPCDFLPMKTFKSTYDPKSRMQKFSFDYPWEIYGLYLRPTGQHSAQSIYVAFFNGPKFLFGNSYAIPIPQSWPLLYFSTKPWVGANTILVFYLDRLRQLDPFSVHFC